jgi:hypothetical protein
MWDMRRNLNPQPLPQRRCTIQFHYAEPPENQRNWWLVVDHGNVDLCLTDPGYDVDLVVNGSLRAMTAVWMGLTTVQREVQTGALKLSGDPRVASAMQSWLGLSPLAVERNRVAA